MREILFRGKRKDILPGNEWVYGYLVDFIPGETEIAFGFDENEQYQYEAVIPETVGQYTGLNDKNGKKVFEGDILSAHFDDLFPDSESILVVGNNGFAFTLKCRDCEPEIIDKTDIPYFKDNFEAIGNIHDNPELLKGE